MTAAKGIFIAVLVLGAAAQGSAWDDPHRPACGDDLCRRAEVFVKARYCEALPLGYGPECSVIKPAMPHAGIDVQADFRCEWHEGRSDCSQAGQPSPDVRRVLRKELRRLGLPLNPEGTTYFVHWWSAVSGWSLAAAYYSHRVGSDDVDLCQVVLLVDRRGHVVTLRELEFQRTDVDKPAVTEWVPLDIADADGDGQPDVILAGNAYEDHWIEVVSIQPPPPRTVFSGLGYYL